MAHGFLRIVSEDFPKQKNLNSDIAQVANTSSAPEVKICNSGLSLYEYKINIILDGRKMPVWKGKGFRQANNRFSQICDLAKKNNSEDITIELWQNDFRLERFIKE